jgi:hypothetical protein
MNILLRLNLLLLLVVAIFDPANLLLHAKVPLFVGVWILIFADIAISRRGRYQVPPDLYLYLYIFVVLLPLIGMFIYVLRGGGMKGYDGFAYYKSYLFLTLCIPLAMKRIDLIRPLSMILSVLSLATLVLYVMTFDDEPLRGQLWLVGDTYGFFTLYERSYASFTYPLVYFYTSSLLVVAIGYFCYQSLFSVGRARFWNVLLLLLNVCGMLLSGTRNNMIIGLLMPLMVIAWYKGTKVRLAVGAALALVFSVGLGFGVVQAMLSSDEFSNTIKLLHYQDYMSMFGDWRTLLFGQGLGASFLSTALGTRVSITELTYLEFIRTFGLIIAAVYYGLLLFPVGKLREQSFRGIHYLLLAYASYLLICVSNPLLLSSSGMLVLAIVIATVFPAEDSVSDLRHRNYAEHLTQRQVMSDY